MAYAISTPTQQRINPTLPELQVELVTLLNALNLLSWQNAAQLMQRKSRLVKS